jgi:hypothetical protein
LHEGDDRNDQFDGITENKSARFRGYGDMDKPKRGVQKTTESLANPKGDLFCCITEQGCQGDNGNEVDDENSHRGDIDEMDSNTNRCCDEQKVDPGVENRSSQLTAKRERFVL